MILGILSILSTTTRFGCFFFGILAVGGFIMAICQKKDQPFPRFVYRTGKFLFCLWLATFIAAEGFIVSGSFSDAIPKNTDYLLVLGAGLRGKNPSTILKGRILSAEKILNSNPNTKAVLCGGQGSDEVVSEASVMYRVMTQDGIDPDRLLVEDESRNTLQNVQNAIKRMDADANGKDYKTAFATSNFHLSRARYIMEHYGLDPIGIGSHTRFFHIEALCYIREYFGWGKLLLTGGS